MNTVEYISLNGELFLKDEAIFGASNRAFRYGDSLFETIHANGTEIQFLEDHLNRLSKGIKTLGMIIPNNFNEKIRKDITYLINKNKAFSGTRIRLSVFRNDGGLYTPANNNISYLIETSPLKSDKYQLNKKGLKIGIYTDVKKSSSLLSQFKTGNSLLFIMAANHKLKMNLDDCLLINEGGNIVESTSSNVFIVKNNVLMTPGIDCGAVAGIMREQLIKAALNLNLTIYEDCDLSIKDIYEADEIFLSNAITGIKWVVAFEDRRFFNKTAKILIEELNKNTFKF